MFSAEIRFVDVGGIRTGVNIQPIPDASAPTTVKIGTFLTVFHAHQFPGVESYSLCEWTEAEVTGAVASAVGSNCEKALINYHYIDADDNTQYRQMWLPNPDLATHFELVEGVGYRMLPASVALLEASMSTATGLTIVIDSAKQEYRQSLPTSGAKKESALRFTDQIKDKTFMSFPLATDSAALVTFGEALNTDGFTKSILDRAFFLARTDVLCDPLVSPGLPATGVWGSVETRAYLKFTYMDGTRKKFMRLMLPGVKQSDCELKDGKAGWKVKKVVGDGIATALTGFFGSAVRTFRYVNSKVDVVDLVTQ